jgi:dTDP-4-dehydrorhamnose reductase
VPSVLVLGGSGLVGSRLLELWRSHLEIVAPTHADLDVLDTSALAACIAHTPADAVVNLVAWADVDAAEAQANDRGGAAYRLNAEVPHRLAELCGQHRKHLLHVSTDYVFDGTREDRPYREDDATHALCWYAQTKLDGELAVLTTSPEASVVRIEMPFTGRPAPKGDIARAFLARLQSKTPIKAVSDQRITPVFLDDAVAAMRIVLEQRRPGVVHVAAASDTTPFEFACAIAGRLRLDAELVEPTPFDEFAASRPARRPRHSWLDVAKFERSVQPGVLRSVDEQLDAWAAQLLAAV